MTLAEISATKGYHKRLRDEVCRFCNRKFKIQAVRVRNWCYEWECEEKGEEALKEIAIAKRRVQEKRGAIKKVAKRAKP